MGGPNVHVTAIGRAVEEDLRPEVTHVETEHAPLAHRPIPARRGPHPALGRELYRTEGRQPPADIGVRAVELDGDIEAADPRDRKWASLNAQTIVAIVGGVISATARPPADDSAWT